MQRWPPRPVLASPRSYDESSADRSDAGTGLPAGLLRFQGPFSEISSGSRAATEGRLRMCGIIGYVGSRASKPLLLAGLAAARVPGLRLGRDRAARGRTGSTTCAPSGNLENLNEAAGPNGSVSTTGLGHTRWATHGGVTEANAHPLTACDDEQAGDRPERDRRELPRAARGAARRRAHVHVRDRRRGDRAPARGRLRRRPRRGRARRVRRGSRATSPSS